MSIHFSKIRWQNFLSTGNQFTEIFLNKSSSTLIVGENGAGKSTLLDAILFALYGKPYRNINKPQLVNSITNKNCLVEIEFSVKNVPYMVRRGIKPAVFEIYRNGDLVDQHASVREYQEHLEKQILKLNHKSFTQIVVIGSANFTPFMQLRPHERRSVIEDLLDIEIFSKMNLLLKEKISTNKEQLSESKYQIDLLDQNIELTRKHMNELRSMQKMNRTATKKKIKQIEEESQEIQEKVQTLSSEVEILQESIADHSSLSTKQKKLDKFNHQLKSKINNLNKEISFFEDNDTCPTCDQDLDSLFVDKRVEKNKVKKQEIEDGLEQLQKQYTEVSNRLAEISAVQTQISELNREISSCNAELSMHRRNIEDLENKLEEEVKVGTEYSIKDLLSQRDTLSIERRGLLETKERYEIAYSLLKDGGIKTKIIRQYIPVINKLMNKYLAAMDFFVQFELDENFNEKIKSRFRDEFSYDSFSEGEKMRIDLALLFTWRAVAKLRNSATTNLLIMDEVFDSSLDSTGTDEFLKIITDLNKDTSVFVISHKGDQLFDKFHSNIRFEKVKNFSQIAA